METMRYSRRTFVAWVGGAGAGFYLFGRLPGLNAPIALAQIPGGTLDPDDVAKFATPMLIPPACPERRRSGSRAASPSTTTRSRCGRSASRSSLPTSPTTTVWGYGALAAQSNRGLLVHHAPSLTIEATWNRPVRVKWINELVDESGNFLPHLLPVDPTLHWANPSGGIRRAGQPADVRRDARPVHRPCADRHPRTRRSRRRRRQRRLRRGLVSARGERHPAGLRQRGHLVRLLRRQGRRSVRRRRGGLATQPSSIRTRTAPRRSGTTTTRSG